MLKKFLSIFVFVFLVIIMYSNNSYAAINIDTIEGWDIFNPATDPGAAVYSNGTILNYRYGPSFIMNSDGSIDRVSSSPGDNSGYIWDCIRYEHSIDGGETWGNSTIVVYPTAGSDDARSCCDPKFAYFGGYYYITYDSTTYNNGTNNQIFIARSTSPTGPYEKWNGNGWGGSPKAFIAYTGPDYMYGVGSCNMVVKNNTIYLYYHYFSMDANFNLLNQTRVATADPSDANWPGNITYRGVAITKTENNEDASDVKYIDAYDKFIAIDVSKRLSDQSFINAWESTDGLTFTPCNMPRTEIRSYGLQAGMSGDGIGHIDITKNNFIAYAYGRGNNNTWAYWYTHLNPVTFTDNRAVPAIPDVFKVYPSSGKVDIYFETVPADGYRIKYGTSIGNYTTIIDNVTSSPYSVTGLSNGTKYYFVVEAINGNGSSGNSGVISSTPLQFTTSPLISASASSYLSGWEASKVIDGLSGTAWSSNVHSGPANTEWVCVDTGANRTIKRVTLTQRQPENCGFPDTYRIQVSQDGNNWVNSDVDFKHISLPSGQNVFEFSRALFGRYVRVYATKLNTDWTLDSNGNFTNFIFQLAEIKVEEIPYTTVASSTVSGWDSNNVIDGLGTCWSSSNHPNESAIEWIYTDLGTTQMVEGLRLIPRATGYCFPKDFQIQYSTDAINWTTPTGFSFTNYPNPGSDINQTFRFSTPVSARYVRVYATKLGTDDQGAFYFQLAEMNVETTIISNGYAKSTLNGWDTYKAVDGNSGTCWSSVNYPSATPSNNENAEYFYVDMGAVRTVMGIKVTPHDGGQGLPKDLKIQYVNPADGTWITIDELTLNDCPAKEETLRFSFPEAVNTRYIRMYCTELNTDSSNAYYMQLGEVTVIQ